MQLLSIVAVFVTFVAHSTALSSMEFGMAMTIRAYDAVCWYEKLKQFPETDSQGYTTQCFGQAEGVKKQINDDEMAKRYFGDWMVQLAMSGLPAEYGSACDHYLKKYDLPAFYDESEALNDGEYNPYPYQGFAYCMLNQLRQKFGDEAIEAVKNEKTRKKKHWMTTLLDRDNEFRARHDAPPMQLVKELNEAAQRWAEKNARECNLDHSDNSDPGRKWNGGSTGESLSAGPDVPPEDAAYIASDGWYEEIREYPYPGGFRGGDTLFGRIGHFTQSVWKKTLYVGYGYAVNKKCRDYQFYIAARYSPAGNVQGEYQRNVLPPRSR